MIGNLCNDPEIRVTTSGKSVSTFRMAVNRRKRSDGQPEADYFRVSAWGNLSDNCQKYLKKGKKVLVSGPVSISTYQNKDGQFRAVMEVIADEVEFLSPKEQEQTKNGYVQVDTNDLPLG